MNKEQFIQANTEKANRILVKAFIIGLITISLDLIYLFIKRDGHVLQSADYLIVASLPLLIIPLLYHRFSKKKEHFLIISIISI